MTKGSPTITIRLPLVMKWKLADLAGKEGQSVTEFVRSAISARMALVNPRHMAPAREVSD